MTTKHEIDRLAAEGAQFSIATGPFGYVVRIGNYVREVTPQLETSSLEEAMIWLRAQVALARARAN